MTVLRLALYSVFLRDVGACDPGKAMTVMEMWPASAIGQASIAEHKPHPLSSGGDEVSVSGQERG